MNKKKQASAPRTRKMGAADFTQREETVIYWLGSGGIFLQSHGVRLMIDPVICTKPDNPLVSEAGYSLLVPPPVEPEAVLELDAILYTHADYDHLAKDSARGLLSAGAVYYGTPFVRNTLLEFGIPEERICTCQIGETFSIGSIALTLTPASHSWQKDRPEFDWCFGPEDCCGFYLKTKDGNVWIPGDSILMEEHLRMKMVDWMFFDISSDPYHFGTENALRLANTLQDAQLILYHYGTYDAPDKPAFNADPEVITGRLQNPERLHIPAPGEPVTIRKNEN